MKTITKREFQIMALYSKGLKFKEMAQCLNIAERTAINYFMRVKAKDKSRITRAKQSRTINKQSYIVRLKEVLHDAKKYNRDIKRNRYTFLKEISIKNQSKGMRLNYFNECLLFTHKSYNEMKLKSLKKCSTKVNT